jgi:3-phosphoshikimate 1-carboxyvinyltransferase
VASKPFSRHVGNVKKLYGEIFLHGDKSISHRALIMSSLANGVSQIRNLAPGNDCKSTMKCLQALGVKIDCDKNIPGTATVEGNGINELVEANKVLNAHNSGTTIRLLTGILASRPFLSIVTGDASLRRRPMKRLIEPLSMMGAEIYGMSNNSFAPLVIRGKELQGINYDLKVPSAQIKSAIILAALFASGKTVIDQEHLCRDHTELMLAKMGAKLETSNSIISVSPLVNALKAITLSVPGDISSAAYWMVAAAIHPNAHIILRNCGINPTRTGILDVLNEMGAKITVSNKRLENNEQIADIDVESSQLRGVAIEGAMVPRLIDEIPVLAVAACFAKGRTIIRDASELRVKESDRIATTVSELSRMGAKVEMKSDGMIIQGSHKLDGTFVRSYNDHRLAMSLAIAGLMAKGETVINNANVVDISYPGFWNDLNLISQ